MATLAKEMKSWALAAVILGMAGVPAWAADPATPGRIPIASGWEVTVAGYGWITGLNGTVATLPPAPAVGVSIGADQVLRNFEGGFMAAGEVRYGRYVAVADILYAKLGASVNPRGPLFNSASLETSSFVGTVAGGYRVVDEDNVKLDVLAGIRAVSVWTEVSTTSVIPALNLVRSETQVWVDPIIGLKARYNFAPSWYLTGWGFIGGFGAGSRVTWDTFGGLGYQISSRVSVVAGYRALGIDYRNGGYIYDITQHGPLIGLVGKF